jgi:hypothetical protein
MTISLNDTIPEEKYIKKWRGGERRLGEKIRISQKT